jgi:hypothetical protein
LRQIVVRLHDAHLVDALAELADEEQAALRVAAGTDAQALGRAELAHAAWSAIARTYR